MHLLKLIAILQQLQQPPPLLQLQQPPPLLQLQKPPQLQVKNSTSNKYAKRISRRSQYLIYLEISLITHINLINR